MPSIAIQKIDFTLPCDLPYSEGHVLSVIEANALNQTWSENLRNNFAPKVKALVEAGTDETALEALREEFSTYAGTYTFAQRTPRAPSDPVGHEAHKLAKAAVVAALKGKSIDMKTFPAAKLEALVEQLLEKRPEYRAEAERRVAAAQAISSDVLGLMDEDGSEDGSETPTGEGETSTEVATPTPRRRHSRAEAA